MGNSDSVPDLRPEEVQSLRQTFTAEELESMLEHASSMYGEKYEDMDHEKVIAEVEAIKVKHEQEMKKKDELLREAKRTLNEVRWELEEVTEQNRRNEAELKRLKEEAAGKDVEGTSQSDQSQQNEEKERAELVSRVRAQEIQIQEHMQEKENIVKEMQNQCDLRLIKFGFMLKSQENNLLEAIEVKNKHCEILVSCSDDERNCMQADVTACKLM